MKGCLELRLQLERLTNPPGGAQAVQLEAQIHEIASLRRSYPHKISLEERASVARQRTNCIMYALGIDPDEVVDWCGAQIHPGLDFMAWLIAAEKLTAKTVEVSEANDGDVIVYLDSYLRPLHAGVANGGQVISKWGSGGTHIWRHGLFEVPSSYGNDPRVYGAILPTQAVLAFREWAESSARKRATGFVLKIRAPHAPRLCLRRE